MSATFRNRFIGDKPRHDQFSTVKDLSVTQVGWLANAAGDILAVGNINPPQFFVRPVSPTEFVLQCPKGNPVKTWAFFTTDEGIVATVEDYSSIADGFLTITLASAPVGNVRIRGYVAYGRNAGELKGAVGSAPEHTKPLISHNQYKVQGLLKQLMMFPVGWFTDGAGDVTTVRAPLGTTVEHTGAGEYTIQFDVSFPGIQNRWADLFGNSIGQGASFAYPGGAPQRVVVTLDADMGDGERSAVMFIGPVSKYPTNYGGGSGGVHDDLTARDVHNYSNFPHQSPLRSSCFIPFHARIGSAGIVADSTHMPANSRITLVNAGTYDIYIGTFAEGAIVGGFNFSDGAPTGIVFTDGPNGIIRVQRDGGVSPAQAETLNGFVIALTQNVR